ncbi:MAG: hypothetical protein ABIH90_00070 [Candidatus Aenigmatarchaeota archaeon]
MPCYVAIVGSYTDVNEAETFLKGLENIGLVTDVTTIPVYARGPVDEVLHGQYPEDDRIAGIVKALAVKPPCMSVARAEVIDEDRTRKGLAALGRVSIEFYQLAIQE